MHDKRECCDMCDYSGEWKTRCAACILKVEKKKCSTCESTFCEFHGKTYEVEECCGRFYCGDKGQQEGCMQEKHNQTKKLKKCGHMGCTFYKGCRACDVTKAFEDEKALFEGDKKLLDQLLPKLKSREMKKKLRHVLESTPRPKEVFFKNFHGRRPFHR